MYASKDAVYNTNKHFTCEIQFNTPVLITPSQSMQIAKTLIIQTKQLKMFSGVCKVDTIP